MGEISILTEDQVKDVQTIVAAMLAPNAGDKKISQLDAMPAIANADLFAMVDITDSTTKKGTVAQISMFERELISGSDYRLNPRNSLNDRPNTSTAYQIGKVDVLSAPGTQNVCIGEGSNGSLTTGQANVFSGYNSGKNSTSGSFNCYFGWESGKNGLTAQFNTAFGYKTLTAVTNASNNTVMGNQCGAALTSGGYNTLIGASAGVQTTTAVSTIGIGREAARINNAAYLIAIGHQAGRANLVGTGDVYIGKDAGLLATGNNNTFVGYESGVALTTGGNNTLYGYQTGALLTTHSGNVHLGYQAGAQSTESNTLYVANSNTPTPLIKGDFSAKTLIFNAAIGNVNDLSGKVLRWKAASGNETLDQSQLNSDGASGLPDQWQSVTNGISGYLSKVTVKNGSGVLATNCTVTIYKGISSSGPIIAQETGISAAHGVLTDVPITIKPHFLNTEIFTIGVSGTNWAWDINTAGGYAGGSYKGLAADAVFRTYVDVGYNLEFSNTGELLYSGQDLNLSGIPLVIAELSTQQDDKTGDGTLYPIIFDDDSAVNHNGDYNPATGIFTARVTGIFKVAPQVYLRAIGAAHTGGIVYINTTSQSLRIYQGNPANEADSAGNLSVNGSASLKLSATDTVQIQAVVSGGAKTVDIGIIGISQLSIKLESTS